MVAYVIPIDHVHGQQSKGTKAGGKGDKEKKPSGSKKAIARKTVNKKVLKPTHDNGSDSVMDLDNPSVESTTGPVPDQESALPVRDKNKDVHEKYQVVCGLDRPRHT